MILLLALSQAAEVGGYVRVMTRPDFAGGDGKLGYWNLYGRLLNEGPYVALEFRQAILERAPGSTEPWAALRLKVEGGSIQNADPGGGSLANLRLSQVYVLAGNVGGLTWRLGTLLTSFGDLALYDMRPGQVLTDAIGGSVAWRKGPLDVVLGVGDAGYAIRSSAYNTVGTVGGTVRLSVPRRLELGVGGQAYYEPRVVGNRNAPHVTPDVGYEDYLRGEILSAYVADNPDLSSFPDPVPTDATSWKAIGYLGFGNLGPVRWNNFYASVSRRHPELSTTESWEGVDYTIYTNALTDERTDVMLGNELTVNVVPERLDLAWGLLYGNQMDGDNDLAPSNYDRVWSSTVLRTQTYLTPRFHLLVEGSAAREWSRNGNAYRNHADSIFASTGGQSDAEGLEYGDSDTRITVQGKGGVVISPLGPGIYTRPSLRILYGLQYSTQNNAFGNSFVETIDEYDDFENVERHLHHVFALEAEAWF